MDKNKKLYTISQAAKKLDISKQAVLYALNHKLIKGEKICGINFIPANAIRKYKPRKKNKKKGESDVEFK